MHIEELTQQMQKLMVVIEDLFIEKQCCRTLIIDKGLMTESVIDAALERAKENPENRRAARESFAQSRAELEKFAKAAYAEYHMIAPPPTDKTN
jgi:hypothetical protein